MHSQRLRFPREGQSRVTYEELATHVGGSVSGFELLFHKITQGLQDSQKDKPVTVLRKDEQQDMYTGGIRKASSKEPGDSSLKMCRRLLTAGLCCQ
jgi:hypothetical protein